MAYRTTDALVQAILGRNYDFAKRPDLTQFIATANVVVTRANAIANGKSRVRKAGGMTAQELQTLETWLAAHFYLHSDPLYNSRSTEGASGSFQVGTPGAGLASTQYGRTALDLDWTGALKNINMQQFASVLHMGNKDDDEDDCGTAT